MVVGPLTKVVLDATDEELRADVEKHSATLRAIHVDLDALYRGEPRKSQFDELKEKRDMVWATLEYALAEIKRREENKLQQINNELVRKYVDLTGNYVRLTKWLVGVAALSVVVATVSIAVTLLTWWFRR